PDGRGIQIEISPENQVGHRYKGVGQQMFASRLALMLQRTPDALKIYQPNRRVRGLLYDVLHQPTSFVGNYAVLPREDASRVIAALQRRAYDLKRISLLFLALTFSASLLWADTRLASRADLFKW